MTQAMLAAEKTSRPAHTAPWSPKIKAAYQEVNRINRTLKQQSQISVNQLKSGQTHGSRLLRDLWKQRIKAIRRLQLIRHEAFHHRQTYLEEAADVQELKGNGDRARILQNIRNVEELRRTYGHIRYATKNANQINGLTRVSYPTTTGWKTTTNPTDLEAAVLNQLTQHFGQASNTPLAEHGEVYKIAEGGRPLPTAGLPDTEKSLKKWFTHTSTQSVDAILTEHEFRKGIQR